MKIAYILTPIEFGGAERVSLTFLKNVDRKKFDIHPILLIRPWEEDNIFIQKLEDEKFPIVKVPVARFGRDTGRDYFRIIRCFKRIYSFLKYQAVDIVHTHGYFADIIGICAARMLRLPTVSTCHGYITNDFQLSMYNRMDRLVLRFAHKIIAVSQGIEADLLRSGIHESRITCLQNAVNSYFPADQCVEKRQEKRKICSLSNSDFVIGYVGRLSEEKGVKYLVEAISMLKDIGLQIKLLIIGEGPQREYLKELIGRLNIKDNVFFAGFQSDIENWFPSMDIFVLPSLTEGTPMSLLEAMSYGIPVIASSVGGVPQVVDPQKNGILVPPGNPNDIASAIQFLYSNEDVRRRFSQDSKQKIQREYNVTDWINKIESVYLKALKIAYSK